MVLFSLLWTRGERESLQPLILDLQATARGLDQGAEAAVERAIAEADLRLDVCPNALAIPTQAPLDSFNARTCPACYVEWCFGDGAPGLDRERPILFEQVAPTTARFLVKPDGKLCYF